MAVSPFDHEIIGGLFGDDEVGALLSPGAEIGAMMRFEAALARVEGRLGVIPEASGEAIAASLSGLAIEPNSLAEATSSAGVVVPGLVSMLRDRIGPPHGDYLHWGATSQDVLDTALILRLRDVLSVLETRLDTVIEVLAEQAERHAGTVMAARTRSQLATPTTFGLRIGGWLTPLVRCRERLAELRPRLLVLQFGGASGTLSVFGTRGIEVMAALAAELGLGVPAKPWHAERDTLAELAGWLALVTGALGKMAGDLILMGRSEIREATAGDGGGSSTMPQKSNPVSAETLVTLARFNAGQSGLCYQAMLHAEERDSTAWAMEWATLPQMLVATASALSHAAKLSRTLAPDPARMNANLTEAALAEALAFALAEHMPLSKAQGLVKQAARRGGSLFESIVALTDTLVEWESLRDPGKQTGAAKEMVARVVAEARKTG